MPSKRERQKGCPGAAIIPSQSAGLAGESPLKSPAFPDAGRRPAASRSIEKSHGFTDGFASVTSRGQGLARRQMLGLAAASLLSAGLAAPAVFAGSGRQWTILAMEHFPPYNYHFAQKFIGIDVDIIAEAGLLLGVELKTIPLSWPRAILGFEAGQADGLYQVAPTPARFQRWNMVGPMRMTRQSFAIRADDPRQDALASDLATGAPYDLSLLAGQRVGVVNGFTYTEAFDRATGFEKEGSIDDLTSLRKLLLGRVTTVLGGSANLRYAARRLGVSARIRILQPPLAEVPRYVSFRRDAAGDAKARLMQEALAELWLRGSIERILAAHGEG